MTTAAHHGPALAITGTCEGCAHLITDARDPRLGRGPHAACVHPDRANGGLIFARARGPWPTPADCPLLPVARLALARSIVAADERKGAALCPGREAAWERMTQHARLMTALPSPCAISFGPLRIACDCGAARGVTCADHYGSTAHGAGESEEQKR